MKTHCCRFMAQYVPLPHGVPPPPFVLKDCKSISCNGENIKKINYYIFCKLEFPQQNASFVTQ